MEDAVKTADPSKVKAKFSSFFKSLVIELDKDLYGPDNHLVEVGGRWGWGGAVGGSPHSALFIIFL